MTPPKSFRALEDSSSCKPVFQEQWHAEAIAVVELLIANGILTADNWSRTLGDHLAQQPLDDEPYDEGRYYEAFLATLEFILHRDGIASSTDVMQRERDWRRAYLNTPHGKPVVLPDYRWSP